MGQISLTGQALALHNLNTNGLITRTAAGTVAGRTIASGTGIAVTDGDGVAGSPVTALSGQALALHNLGTNGLITRTAAGTVAGRTIASGTGIAVTDGDGVAGSPVTALSGQALALHNITDNGIIYRTGTGTFAAATSGTSSFLRNQVYTTGTVNYLAAVGTYATIGVVPAGFRFAPQDLIFTVDAVTGAVGSTDTMPVFRVYNSNSATVLANQITPTVSPFSSSATLSINQWARSSLTAARSTTATPGDTLYLRVDTAYAIGNGSYTVLNGKVILTGYLY